MGNVYLNENTQVIITDIEASNGVIHVIDSVLLPPSDETAMESMDIVDTAVADGRFTTLVAAVQAAELVDTLKGEGPFTVFAPTDDAFAALPAGTLDSLLLPENKQQLTDILLYHVVPGKVMASDVVGLSSASTVLGQDVTITVQDGNVFLNENVQIIITDIETSNGGDLDKERTARQFLLVIAGAFDPDLALCALTIPAAIARPSPGPPPFELGAARGVQFHLAQLV
jgi:transforming growth factor-beta-induced protein